MTHLNDDQVLLYAYGELPEAGLPSAEKHLAACDTCRARLIAIEEGRTALEWGLQRSAPRARRVWWVALPLAAGIGALLLARSGPPARPADVPPWQSHLIASPNAGYVTSGLMSLDSQLTRLEQGRIQ